MNNLVRQRLRTRVHGHATTLDIWTVGVVPPPGLFPYCGTAGCSSLDESLLGTTDRLRALGALRLALDAECELREMCHGGMEMSPRNEAEIKAVERYHGLIFL